MTATATALPRTSRAATGRNLAAFAARAWKVTVTGADSVPHDGPVLLASYHSAYLDGLLLAAAAPRPVHLLASAELFAPPFARLLRGTGQIPVDHELPDRHALLTAVGVLEAGGAVGVFPEGVRGTGDLPRGRLETAYLAALSGAVVVPGGGVVVVAELVVDQRRIEVLVVGAHESLRVWCVGSVTGSGSVRPVRAHAERT